MVIFQQLLTKFLIVEDLYVAFYHNRKRSKGRKNKLEGRTLAMSELECRPGLANVQTVAQYHVRYMSKSFRDLFDKTSLGYKTDL